MAGKSKGGGNSGVSKTARASLGDKVQPPSKRDVIRVIWREEIAPGKFRKRDRILDAAEAANIKSA